MNLSKFLVRGLVLGAAAGVVYVVRRRTTNEPPRLIQWDQVRRAAEQMTSRGAGQSSVRYLDGREQEQAQAYRSMVQRSEDVIGQYLKQSLPLPLQNVEAFDRQQWIEANLEGFQQLFEPLVARGLPMICANPDLVVERGDKLIYCAGALAARYAEIGGAVAYAGKPHRPAYERAFQVLSQLRGAPLATAEILAIGDGVETDIRGGCEAGLDTVMIASAVHLQHGLSADSLSALFEARSFAPVAALETLRW